MKNFKMEVTVLAAVKIAEQYEKEAKLRKAGDFVVYNDYEYVVDNNLIERYGKYPQLLNVNITNEDNEDEVVNEDEVIDANDLVFKDEVDLDEFNGVEPSTLEEIEKTLEEDDKDLDADEEDEVTVDTDKDEVKEDVLPLYDEIKANEIKTMLDVLGVDYADAKSKKSLYKLLEDNYNV